MSLMNPTRDIREPDLSKGNFEGYVIDNNDPEKRQRVKLRIPVLHRDIPDDKIPWANVQQGGSANAGAGVGTVNVPDKGAKMIITYQDGDSHNPQYGGSATSDDVNKDNELLNDDYPSTQGYTDSHGNRFSTNRATGDITIAHKSGAIVHIDGGGNVTIASAGDLYLAANGNIAMAAGGRMALSAAGNITLDGANVLFNSGSAASPQVPGQRSTPSIPDRSGQTSL